MISLRQLLVVVLVGAGVWLLKRLQDRFRANRAGSTTAAKSTGEYQDMVRCSQCGVYIPRLQAAGNDRHGYRCREAPCANPPATAGSGSD